MHRTQMALSSCEDENQRLKAAIQDGQEREDALKAELNNIKHDLREGNLEIERLRGIFPKIYFSGPRDAMA